MKICQIKTTAELNNALANVQHPNIEIYENADRALSRAAALSSLLRESAYIAKEHNETLRLENIAVVSDSINREIEAVKLMLSELNNKVLSVEIQA